MADQDFTKYLVIVFCLIFAFDFISKNGLINTPNDSKTENENGNIDDRNSNVLKNNQDVQTKFNEYSKNMKKSPMMIIQYCTS